MDTLVVPRTDLGNMDLIAEGGQGKIFRLTHFRLPDFPSGVVFKEYRPDADFVAAGLRAIVQVRSKMSPQDQATLDRYAIWPSRVVVNNGSEVIGVLMPLIPPSYLHSGISRVPGPRNGAPKTFLKEREIQYLFVDPDRCVRLGFPLVNLKQRLGICLEMARALSFLSSHHIVFGDISAKNALFRIGPNPGEVGLVLVDCDAVRVAGSAAAVKQLNSPDWDPPEGARAALTHATDVYKFALFLIRVLSPSGNASVSRDPRRVQAIFDQRGMMLLQRSLGSDPGGRPPISEWSSYLETFILQQPPVRVLSNRQAVPSSGAPSQTGVPPRSAAPVASAPRAGWKKVNGKWQKV